MSRVAWAKDALPACKNAARKLPSPSVMSQVQTDATTKKNNQALKYWNSVGSLFMVLLPSNEKEISHRRVLWQTR